MATQVIPLPPAAWVPDDTNGPQLSVVAGTNFPVVGWAFDGGATDEKMYTRFRASNYGSGNLTLDIDWYADTASSGNVRFGCALAVITPDTDSQDVETDTFATVNEANDSHLGTVGQRMHRASITISNLDSLAADDDVVLFFYREASDTTNDTMSGDAIVTNIQVSYSDV